MTWTDPRTWVAGEKPSAATLNTHIRDNFKAIGDAWTSFTPNWSAPTPPAIGNGTKVGRYIQVGKLVIFQITITMGSTTTYGTGSWTIDVPVTAVSGRNWRFNGIANDFSAGLFPLLGIIQSAGTTMDLRCDATTAGNQLRAVNPSSPFTWANGDILSLGGIYEAA